MEVNFNNFISLESKKMRFLTGNHPDGSSFDQKPFADIIILAPLGGGVRKLRALSVTT